jgi:hypothetical protein
MKRDRRTNDLWDCCCCKLKLADYGILSNFTILCLLIIVGETYDINIEFLKTVGIGVGAEKRPASTAATVRLPCNVPTHNNRLRLSFNCSTQSKFNIYY